MATILLSAAGAAIGGLSSGTVLGLTGAAIGRAAGATLGRVIDQRLLGAGSDPVEYGRVERFRLTGAGEGAPIAQLWGRMRLGGQVIWATQFVERTSTSGGGSGKGAPPQPKTTTYSYAVSLALALCEGEIRRIGRVWADGVEVDRSGLTVRVYTGRQDQMPDPLIEAVEGAGQAPAYRGVAYVVIEDLDLSPYGNRVPQLAFEVVRAAQPVGDVLPSAADMVRAVALMPGTGEYVLATRPVTFRSGLGSGSAANVSAEGGGTDLSQSLEQLRMAVPNLKSVSLIYSWFGDDLRAGACRVQPKVEDKSRDGVEMAWRAGGIGRDQAEELQRIEDRPVYGGTPADGSVIEAIRAVQAEGQAVLFYPFLLMEILEGNARPDPYTDGEEQPPLPWRGRITGERAPGLPDSPDGTVANRAAVDAFFGTATADDFNVANGRVSYSGPAEWSYTRFILHSAALCAAAGGVDAFCVGSEMRGLTQMRDDAGFPAVARLRALAQEVRQLLPQAKLSYAADWSEYFGYQPQDGSGDVYFHLDPLWSDPEIDFIAIDNYMPLSDWRDGPEHADADWGSIHDLDYLRANIEGGEGYDWYYPSDMDRAAQTRVPIAPGAGGEAFLYRYKDLRGWWENLHVDHRGGVPLSEPSPWVPRSKPIWFTEIGCGAIDKGTNQPNKFLDPKSSESATPYFSTGRRDDLIQAQYLRAIMSYWDGPQTNPISDIYGGPMLDLDRAHVWAWDARPWPAFPNDQARWSDGANWERGHWISGRIDAVPLDQVVAELCEAAGVTTYDVSRLHGLVRGYLCGETEGGRARLQSLMLAHGFQAVERGGALTFLPLPTRPEALVREADIAVDDDGDGRLVQARAAKADIAGRVRVRFTAAEGTYEERVADAVLPDGAAEVITASDLPLCLTGPEGQATAERWLADARLARDSLRFSLPPSMRTLGPGSMIALEDGTTWRIDRAEDRGVRAIEAVRVDPTTREPSEAATELAPASGFLAPVPVDPVFMDLPLLTGEEVPHAPHLAVVAQPWPGSVAVYSSPSSDGFILNTLIERAAIGGVLETPLRAAKPGVWDRTGPLRVRISSGALSAAELEAVLNGANVAAVGPSAGGEWEVLQFAGAELIGRDLWEIGLRLRGQQGTDGILPELWPEGSLFLLLNGAPQQITLPASARGLARHYRIGPGRRSLDDDSFVERHLAFQGVGLRPYAPGHLRARRLGADREISWIRRTRIDGDSWEGLDVPLGETREAYLLRISDARGVRREVTLSTPAFTYTSAMRADDAVAAPYVIDVAQLFERFGPGPFARIEIDD